MCSDYQEGAKRIESDDFVYAIVNQGSAAFEGRCVLERAAQLQLRTPILVVARCMDIHCYLDAMELGAVDYLERPDPNDVEWEMESKLGHPRRLLVNDAPGRLRI
jgi:ActR/RegA family two-component response regulator